MALRLRRGTDAERLQITPVEGELIYTTDTKLLYAGDGSTAGGVAVSGAGGGGSTTLDGLTDTDLTSVSNNDVLTYNSGTNKWSALPFPQLSFLSDVNVFGIENGQLISWDASTNKFIPTNNIGGVGSVFTGDVKGSVFSDDSTVMVDSVSGTITGAIEATAFNLTGDAVITGGVFVSDDIDTSSGTISALVGGFVGDIVGDVLGDVVGDLTGNADTATTALNLTGDHKGSVFGDDSTVLVDGVNSKIVGNVDNAVTETTRLQAGSINVGGDTSNLIITTDDSISLILSTTEEAGTINSLKPLRVGGQTAGISNGSVSIWNDSVNASAVISYHASNTAGTVTQTIAKARGDKTAPVVVQVADNLAAWQALGYNGSNYRPAGGLAVTAIGTPAANYVPSQVGLYTATTDGSSVIQFKVDHTGTSTFTGAAKLAVYADATARDAAITTPTAGMMVFNTTGTKFQGYNGSAWVDLN
jgi:hypothetical protein